MEVELHGTPTKTDYHCGSHSQPPHLSSTVTEFLLQGKMLRVRVHHRQLGWTNLRIALKYVTFVYARDDIDGGAACFHFLSKICKGSRLEEWRGIKNKDTDQDKYAAALAQAKRRLKLAIASPEGNSYAFTVDGNKVVVDVLPLSTMEVEALEERQRQDRVSDIYKAVGALEAFQQERIEKGRFLFGSGLPLLSP